jgi:hypothetical protein
VDLRFLVRLAASDPALVLRVAKRKTVKVKNRETGKTVYKSPQEFQENREKYEKLPQSYDRPPKGKPRQVPDPGDDFLPAPPKLPKLDKPPKPKKLKKPPEPVKPPKVPEPPKPAPDSPPVGQKWRDPKKSG